MKSNYEEEEEDDEKRNTNKRELAISPLTYSTWIRSQHMLKLYCSLSMHIISSHVTLCVFFMHVCMFKMNYYSVHTMTSNAICTASAIIIIGLHSFFSFFLFFAFDFARRANIVYILCYCYMKPRSIHTTQRKKNKEAKPTKKKSGKEIAHRFHAQHKH